MFSILGPPLTRILGLGSRALSVVGASDFALALLPTFQAAEDARPTRRALERRAADNAGGQSHVMGRIGDFIGVRDRMVTAHAQCNKVIRAIVPADPKWDFMMDIKRSAVILGSSTAHLADAIPFPNLIRYLVPAFAIWNRPATKVPMIRANQPGKIVLAVHKVDALFAMLRAPGRHHKHSSTAARAFNCYRGCTVSIPCFTGMCLRVFLLGLFGMVLSEEGVPVPHLDGFPASRLTTRLLPGLRRFDREFLSANYAVLCDRFMPLLGPVVDMGFPLAFAPCIIIFHTGIIDSKLAAFNSKLGYNPELEAQKNAVTTQQLGDAMLSAFDQGADATTENGGQQ